MFTRLHQLALLALGRVLQKGEKEIGAGLLAGLLNIDDGTASNIYADLQRLGYLGSNGKFERGKKGRARRWLTRKAPLPKSWVPSRTHDGNASSFPSSSHETVPSSSHETDQGVGHTGPSSDPDPGIGLGPGQRKDAPTVRIVDILTQGREGRGGA